MKIETLKDMLGEVQKIDKNATIQSWDDDTLEGFPDYGVSIYGSVKDKEIIIKHYQNKTWIMTEPLTIGSKKPQDILDIIRSIYNCGKPESKKVYYTLSDELESLVDDISIYRVEPLPTQPEKK